MRLKFSIVVELKAHAIMNLVIPEGDVVLVNGVPLLDSDLFGPSTRCLLYTSDAADE